ncbi:ribonuclease inhibitor-like isoform X2 [Pleurodeles waltl]
MDSNIKSCCAALASLLSVNRSLTELDLSGNTLGGSGMILLCEGLKDPHCSIQKLEMDGCQLTDVCCEALSAVLQMSPSLRDLDLRVNNLGDSGVQHLCEGLKHPDCKIQKLKIKCCCFTDSSCAHLSSVLTVSCNLMELNIGGNDVGDSGMQLLCEGLKHPDCRLQSLWMRHCLLTSLGCADLSPALCTIPSLTMLVLSNNELGDSGVRQLCEGLRHPGCRVQKLWIEYCSLTSSCCADLASVLSANQWLTELDVGGNELGDAGVIQLCQGMKDPHCRIQTLDLTSCSLTGLCFTELASVFRTNGCLTDLFLAQNDLRDIFMQPLFEGLNYKGCKMQVLWIDSCTLSDSCCGLLAGVFKDSLSLAQLYLGNNALGDLGLKQLCQGLTHPNCKIQTLWMGTCSLTGSCGADLSSAISTSQCLTELDLSCNILGDSGFIHLCEGLKQPGCKLWKLWVKHCSLTSACCAELSSALTINQTLTELGLSRNELGDSGVSQLCKGLKHPSCRIQTLLVNTCSLTDSCCADLAAVLRTSQTLTAMHLNYNKLGDSGIAELCEGLKHPNCRIQTLGIVNCSLTGVCFSHLATALCRNQTLTFLDLNDNELGSPGVKQLFDGMKSPGCRIQTLRLTECFNQSLDNDDTSSNYKSMC